jgi:hypothetical protein
VILARPEPRAQKIRPSMGAINDQWSRSPLSESGRHRCPRFKRINDQQLVDQLDRKHMSPTDVERTGAPSCHLATALLIRGSKPDPRRVRTGTPDRLSQGQRGACIRAYPRAHQLEGAPHVVFKSQRGQLVEGSHRGRASAPSVPSERDQALPSKPT